MTNSTSPGLRWRWLPTTLIRLSGKILLADIHLLIHYGWPSWMMSIPNYLFVGSIFVIGMSSIWQEQIDENAASIASGGPRVITYDMAVLLMCFILSVPLGLAVWVLA